MHGVWNNIVKSIESVSVDGVGINELLKGDLGNGRDITFWLDRWVGGITLKERFPHLFKLEKEKKIMVVDRFNLATGSFRDRWNWARDNMSNQEAGEWEDLMEILNGARVENRPDKWEWQGGKEGGFSVKDVKKFLDKKKDCSNRYIMEWCKWVPKKCNVFVWRASMDRIPTKEALKTRNCWNGDTNCALCGEGTENTQHMFCECEVSARIWHFISSWTRSPPFFVFNLVDVLDIHKQQGRGKTEVAAIKGIIIISLWCIWKARNAKIFEDAEVNITGISQSIKTFFDSKIDQEIGTYLGTIGVTLISCKYV